MKLRKAGPSIAASIGCMTRVSIPKRPDHRPEKTTDAASANSSAVMSTLLVGGGAFVGVVPSHHAESRLWKPRRMIVVVATTEDELAAVRAQPRRAWRGHGAGRGTERDPTVGAGSRG